MGNANSNTTSRTLFRSHSQEGLNPRLIQVAMDRAARTNPDIYKPGTGAQNHGPNGPSPDHVTYPEEYEGNEPMDESCGQQPLEPTMVGSGRILGGLMMDDTSAQHQAISYSGRRDCVRLNNNDNDASSRRRGSRRHSHRNKHGAGHSLMAPQAMLRELEGMADANPEDADDFLHAMKEMPPSA